MISGHFRLTFSSGELKITHIPISCLSDHTDLESIYAAILDHPRRLFGDPNLFTKFLLDAIRRCEIIANLIFRWFGLKLPIHAPKKGVLGI